MKKSRHVIVATTVPKRAQAISLAQRLVADNLAACVQFWRIHSVYHWDGALQGGDEFYLQCKTHASLAHKAGFEIRRQHPYALPEVLVLPITGGSPAYLRWLDRETTQANRDRARKPKKHSRSAALRSNSAQRRPR